jgi:surfactin synthase thioesterase subunit
MLVHRDETLWNARRTRGATRARIRTVRTREQRRRVKIGPVRGMGLAPGEGDSRNRTPPEDRTRPRMSTSWFMIPEQLAASATRLVCLPYAGGSAAVYRSWAPRLAPDIELVSVQLPGRGWRLREPVRRDLRVMAEEVAEAIAALDDRPLALFGHSMGAWLGLEVVRRLEDLGREPTQFFASGRQAPSLGCTQPPLSHLTDEGFIAEVQSRYGGIPAEILAERELLKLLLPSLRADIEALERYEYRPDLPVRTPIHAIVGDSDETVAVREMSPWAIETTGGFELTTLRGGHFHFQPDPQALLSVVRRAVRRTVRNGHGMGV